MNENPENDFLYKLYRLKNKIKYEKSPESFTLLTIKIKIIILLYIVQNFLISLSWSIIVKNFYPWFIFSISLLQIGWFWNNIRNSWKINRLNESFLNKTEEQQEEMDLLNDLTPSLEINNKGLN